MRQQTCVAVALVAFFACGSKASAEVVDAGATGFSIQITSSIAAPPSRVFETIVNVGSWWAPDHTFSGNAANLSLDATAGGCWCEKLPGGSVQHMTVVFVDRDKTLRLRGGLGPLQALAIDAVLTFTLKEANGSTMLDVTYRVGGYAPGGFESISKGVDGVLTGQVGRLKRTVETGKP